MKRLLLLLLLASACTPVIRVKKPHESTALPPTPSSAPFVVIEPGKAQFEDLTPLGEVQFKDVSLTIDCDYESIKKLAVIKARELGGNCLLITEHKVPDHKSTCHRIKGKVYRLDNVEAYVQEIPWHENIPLKISDFKGSTEKRPFQAATCSKIAYSFEGRGFSKKIRFEVQTLFDCECSYFVHSAEDVETLQHEQLHFDISELYARKFRKRITEDIKTMSDLKDKHQVIYNDIMKEMRLKQDEYDSEVYGDRKLQKKWNEWVKEELTKYADYSNTVFMIEVKLKH